MGLLVFVMATGYDSRAAGLYFTPRFALLFLLVFLVALVWAVAVRPGLRPMHCDILDAAAALFGMWAALGAALAPVPTLAWLGQYNRGIGALVWISLVLGFVVLRRAASPTTTRVIAWWAAIALVLAGATAVLQAVGIEVVWSGVDRVGGRMTGTTGNPVNLGGLSLLAVWVGFLAFSDRRASWERAAFALAAVFGLAGMVLSVSRAAYVGLALAAALGIVWWMRNRQWRFVVMLAAAAAAVALATVLYSSGPDAGGALVTRIGGETGAQQMTESDQQRTEFWRVAAKAVRDRALTGYGAGAYETAFRRFASVELMQDSPNLVPSDPHSLPLLLASTTGIPGALLAVVLVVGSWVTIGLRLLRSGDARDVAAFAYTVAVCAYLIVSPVDLVTAVPFVVVLGLALGAPSPGSRFTWEIAGAGRAAAGRVVPWLAIGVLSVAVLVATMGAFRLYRADLAEGRSSIAGDRQAAARAAELFPWFSRYAIVAGSALWRDGVHNDATAQVSQGELLLRSVLRRDPYNAQASMELARLNLSVERPVEAAAIVKDGLARTPHHPVLEGLWGFAAATVARNATGSQAARDMIADLQSYGPKTADGWQWLGVALATVGDTQGSIVARDRAKSLAPDLDADAYKKRIQGVQ